MAISVVDVVVGTAGNGGDVTLDLSSSGMQEDDIVYLFGGGSESSDDGAEAGPSTAGYTEIFQQDDGTADFGAWRKAMGATPDTEVVGVGPGNNTNGTVYIAVIVRGADLTTPEDVTPTDSGSYTTDNSPWDGPSITTVTDGCLIISVGFDAAGVVNANGAPSGYSNFNWGHVVETVRFSTAVATLIQSSAGAEDPGAFSDTNDTSNRWELTVAVRPDGGGGATTRRYSLLTVGVG